MKSGLVIAMLVFALCIGAAAQMPGDVMGQHDLSPSGTSPIKGQLPGACLYCHAPHSGVGTVTPLWNQTLSTQTYTPYSSSTYNLTGNKGNVQPPLGADSSLCLSCHDGTVAPGQTVAYKTVPMSGQMYPADVFGTNLLSSHPFSLILPIKDAPELVASLVAQGKTADPTGAIHLVNGNVECTTCHNPHVQAMDPINLNFLVRDSSSGQMCLACHDPKRVVAGQTNRLMGWSDSIHATSPSKTASKPPVGGYLTVAQNACEGCHTAHNASGPARLLRGANEQACVACHSGGSNVQPTPLNVFGEFSKTSHPFTTGNNQHDAAEGVLLNQNRHATCADCHNSHSSMQTTAFTIPPGVRPSQNLLAGISATDGVTVVSPSVNQYENCLRCHGTSTGKVADPKYGYLPMRAVTATDPLNVIPELAPTASSSHPVTHVRSSPLPQPSLLPQMANIDGTAQGRAMGTQIFCSDCHNADDNREFGGTGPNGPHGSRWTHLLERRYEFSQSPTPGAMITNLFPNPDLSVNGPYAMCGKCHDLNQVVRNTSFSQHARHINLGASCSVCHVAHGMGTTSGTISGERMVNFDVKVVAPNGASPVSYSRASNSCTLTCHSHTHH